MKIWIQFKDWNRKQNEFNKWKMLNYAAITILRGAVYKFDISDKLLVSGLTLTIWWFNLLMQLFTSQGIKWMSRTSAKRSGRLGNSKVAGSNPYLTFLNPGWVKPMTLKLILSLPSPMLSKDWLPQCRDNETEWDSRSWCWQPDVPVRQHHIVTMSVHCHKSVPPTHWACLTTVKHSFIPHWTMS